MFKKNNIRKAVVAIIDEHINAAQKEHNDVCTTLELNAEEQHRIIDANLNGDKAEHARTMVKNIASKLLA